MTSGREEELRATGAIDEEGGTEEEEEEDEVAVAVRGSALDFS
jgi:hypothetical protein